jgi:hypothetical protein
MSVDRFVGTWRLLSLEARTATGQVGFPLGNKAQGYLLYSGEGYMSAAIMQAQRAHFGSPDMQRTQSEEKLTAYDTYSSYCGRYEVQGQKVIHHIEVSLFPNWSGTSQERFFEFSEDRLTLSTAPMAYGGVEQRLFAVWQRLASAFL